MSYADYDLNAVNLALDLASLGEGAVSLAEFISRQTGMLAEHGYDGGTDLGALGRPIARVLRTEGEEPFLDALAALLADQPCKPFLTRHDGVPHLHYASDDAPFAQWVASMAAAGLVSYVVRDGRSRLRSCAAAGCGRWFADTSRNSSRRYCSHACASRTTVAAFRARPRHA
jgi:predicted RNA-binding Zn ribbon-like protein